MVAAYVSDVERLISKARLERYRPPSRDDLETIVAYLFNVAVSESLLQGIAAVEIALRNAIHNAFTVHTGTDQWFWAILQRNDLKIVNEKWAKLALELKAPPTSGKIIADLTFGFWPYLFEARYHKLWWADGEALLNSVFPYLPTGTPPHLKIGRAEIYDQIYLFAELRNRAMHHEPVIFGMPRPNVGSPPPITPVTTIHQQIVETLQWLHPQHALTLSFVDRFPDVFANESGRIHSRLMHHFNVLESCTVLRVTFSHHPTAGGGDAIAAR